jgi:hypothetical protein
MPHSTNLTFDLVELHGLKWFNFSMRPTRSLNLGDGRRRDRVNRRVVEHHIAASGDAAGDHHRCLADTPRADLRVSE